MTEATIRNSGEFPEANRSWRETIERIDLVFRLRKANREREREKYLELCSDRILIHIHIVLVNGSHYEFVALRLHPSGDEGGQIQPRISIEHEFIVDDLERGLLRDRIFRHFESATNRT